MDDDTELDEDQEEEDTEEQSKNKRSRTDHLRPWQFKPGQSGNPGGRKPGTKSLKEYAKEYLKNLTDEEKLVFMRGMNKKDIWEMGEGKPDTTTDITSGGKPIVLSFDPTFNAPPSSSEGHSSK
jgi:hypothetical protein